MMCYFFETRCTVANSQLVARSYVRLSRCNPKPRSFLADTSPATVTLGRVIVLPSDSQQ